MKTTISTIFISLLLITNLTSQDSPIKEREIQVEKKYNTEIYAVEPIFDFASINTVPRRSISFTKDSLVGIAPYTPAVDIKVRPVAYKNAPQESLHKAFIKLDKGTTNLYHGQGGYVYSASNYFNIKANGSYDQWQDNTMSDQNIKKIDGSLGMTYYLTNAIKTNIDLGYNKSTYGLYGGQLDPSESTGDVNSYRSYNIKLGLNSFRSAPAKWNYGVNFDLNKWDDNQSEITENNIKVSATASFNPSKYITLNLAPEYIISRSLEAGNAAVISNTITASFNTPRAYITLGGAVARVDSKWELWPNAKIDWNIANQHNVVITSSQSVQPIGAAYLSNINPYRNNSALNNEVPLRPDYKAIQLDKNITAAYNLALNATTVLSLSSELSIINNGLNFQVLEDDATTFGLDLVNYSRLRTQLKAGKSLLDTKLHTDISVTYQRFMNESSTLYHRPDFIISTSVGYSPLNRLNLNLRGSFNSPQTFEEIAIENSGWKANVSFEARYDLLKRVSVYFNADNIINNRYQVWNGYNSFGRNLSGGVLVKF